MKGKNFVMVSDQYGYDLFVAVQSGINIPSVTDRVDEAEVWNDQYDLSKLSYWIAVTGYDLKIRYI